MLREREKGPQINESVAAEILASGAPPPAEEKKGGGISGGWVGLVVIILYVIIRSAFHSSKGESSSEGATTSSQSTPEAVPQSDLFITDIKSAPIEYTVVFLDTGQFPRGNDIKAARIRFLLKAIGAKTGDSSKTIADTASRATDVIKADYGRIVTIQNFLEQAYQYYETGAPRESITALAPILVTLLGR